MRRYSKVSPKVAEAKARWRKSAKGIRNIKKYKKEYYRKNRARSKDRWLVRKYGLTRQMLGKMIGEQKGLCFICKKKPKRLVVDHCHETDKVRRLLCDRCNRIVGILESDPVSTAKAFSYLRNYENFG